MKKENKKGWCSKTRETLKRKLFFQKKREKGKRAKTCNFLFSEKKTHKKVTRPEVHKFQIRVLERGHTQRKHKKEK